MKKVLAILLALLSAISLLTACGDSGEKVPEGPADRVDAVLDRSNDAGKFTMRFFDYILFEDNSTTVRRKVGDSVLLTFPDGKLMLVDTATPPPVRIWPATCRIWALPTLTIWLSATTTPIIPAA